MDSPNRARANAQRLVVLNELHRIYFLKERGLPKYLCEIAALVLDVAGNDLNESVNIKGTKFHPAISPKVVLFAA
jgi:hypothetical protein